MNKNRKALNKLENLLRSKNKESNRKVIKMFGVNLSNTSSALLIALICIVSFVCFCRADERETLETETDNNLAAASELAQYRQPNQITYDDNDDDGRILIDKLNLPILLASLDELGEEGQFWLPSLTSASNERDVGFKVVDQGQHITRDKILDLLAKYKRDFVATEVASEGPVWISETGARTSAAIGGHELSKRDRARTSARLTGGNTYRVTLEEAKRLIRAHQRQQQPNSLPPTTNLNLFTNRQNQQLDPRRPPTSNGGDLLIVPKRTGLSVDVRPGTISTKTSNHQLLQEGIGQAARSIETTTTTPKPGDESSANNDDTMQCNMRRFTYKATKTDQAGNQCSGLITASICYGGCDTGEIADWLFPHKKSIHKVCRHGGRIRRHTQLTHCASSSGVALSPDELDSLPDYHYVDALNCVCKKCTSADTTCLGTMSRPYLQTLSEAVAEIGHQQQPQHKSQRSSHLAAVNDDDGGGGGD